MGQVCCGPSGTTQPLGTACMAACNASGALSRLLCSNAKNTAADATLCAPGETCSRSGATGSTGGLYYTCDPPADAGEVEGGPEGDDAGEADATSLEGG